jgi:hypothetical protein
MHNFEACSPETTAVNSTARLLTAPGTWYPRHTGGFYPALSVFEAAGDGPVSRQIYFA